MLNVITKVHVRKCEELQVQWWTNYLYQKDREMIKTKNDLLTLHLKKSFLPPRAGGRWVG